MLPAHSPIRRPPTRSALDIAQAGESAASRTFCRNGSGDALSLIAGRTSVAIRSDNDVTAPFRPCAHTGSAESAARASVQFLFSAVA